MFQNGLKVGSPNLAHDEKLLAKPPYTFVPIETNPLLNEQATRAIIDIASYRHPVPAIQLLPGRTWIVITDQDNATFDWNGIPGMKFKGAGGEKILAVGKYQCVLPDIKNPYGGLVKTFHVGIDGNNKFSIVQGRDKPNYGMTLEAARQEYKIHSILAHHGLGLALDSLMYGKLVHSSDASDVHTEYKPHDQLGVSISIFDPEYTRLSQNISFLFLETDGRFDVLRFSKNLEERKEPKYYTDNYLQYTRLTAELKRDSILIAKIARHAGHSDNFLTKNGIVIMTDLDSAINLEDLDKSNWGAQLFRDVSFDTLKVVQQLSLMALTPTYLKNLAENKVKPFHEFLVPFFKGLIDENKLNSICDKIHSEYCMFIISNKEKLFASALDYRGFTFIKDINNGEKAKAEWDVFHYNFLPYIWEGCYNIMTNSSLQNGDFKIKLIPPELRKMKFVHSTKEFLRQIWKNYDDAVRKSSRK